MDVAWPVPKVAHYHVDLLAAVQVGILLAKTRCLLLMGISAKGLPKGDPCERQHPFKGRW